MSGTQTMQGSVRKSSGLSPDCVAMMFPHFGINGAASTDYTDGFTIAQALTASPTGTETWEITGFSIRMSMIAVLSSVAAVAAWARWGDIWAGILKDVTPQGPQLSALPVWPGAQFPSDLSTFQKVWTGSEDKLAVANSNTNKVEAHTVVSSQIQLPYPVTVTPGSQLAFAVIMSKSIMASTFTLWISDISYAIYYNTKRRS